MATMRKKMRDGARLKRVSLSVDASESDQALTSELRQLFQLAKAAKRPRVTQWRKNYRIMRNEMWGEDRPSWLPSPAVPEIFPIVATSVGWMTDQRPTFQAIGTAPENSDFAEFTDLLSNDLTTCLHTAWNQHNYDAEIEKVIWDGYTYGTGILKTVWDPALVGGLGDAKIVRVDPFTWYPDPTATNEFDGNYYFEVHTISLQELDRRYPGSARYFPAGTAEEAESAPVQNGTGAEQQRSNPGILNNPNGAFGQDATSDGSTRFGAPGNARIYGLTDVGVTLFECWIREHDLDEDGVLHDGWRVICFAGNHVLMNEPVTELFEHGQHPYSRFMLQDLGEMWGLSMVELLAPSQRAINRLLAALQQNTELTGNPVFLEGLAKTQRQVITNKPGQRLRGQMGSTGWLNPPQPSPLMFELIGFYIAEMERVSGLSAMTRGMSPGGRNAEGVLDKIQESSFVRIRTALRNMERTLRNAGNLAASLITEFYNEERTIQILGEGARENTLTLLSDHFYMPTKQGRLPLRFNLLIDAGSMLATSRQTRIAEADTLYAMGAIDDRAVLEAHNFRNWRIVADRVEAKKQAGLMEGPNARTGTGRKK